MFNAAPFNSTTFNGGLPVPAVFAGSETFDSLTDAVLVWQAVTETLHQEPEGDAPGWSGCFGSCGFNEGPFNDGQLISGRSWDLRAWLSASEALSPLTETASVLARLVIDLSGGSSLVLIGSLQLSWELNRRATCSFEIHYPGGADEHFSPQPGTPVTVLGLDGATLFAGTVEACEEHLVWQPGGAHHLRIQIEAVGWEQVADRRITGPVPGVFDTCFFSPAGRRADLIARDLVDAYLAADGITATGLPTMPELARVVFPYLRVSDALDELTRLTGYWWRISEAKNLEFYEPDTAAPAPITVTDDSSNWVSIKIQRDRSQYRNRQWLSNAIVPRPRQDTIDGGLAVEGERNGTAYWSITLSAQVMIAPTSVLVGGTEYTRAGIWELAAWPYAGAGQAYYWNKGSDTLILTADPAGKTIFATYDGEQEYMFWTEDTAEQAAMAMVEGGSGIYEAIQGDGVAQNTIAGAYAMCDALLDRYVRARTLSIVTDEPGVRPGQALTVSVTKLGVAGTYFVQKVSASDYADGKRLRYTIEATSAQPEDTWAKALGAKSSGDDTLLSVPINPPPEGDF